MSHLLLAVAEVFVEHPERPRSMVVLQRRFVVVGYRKQVMRPDQEVVREARVVKVVADGGYVQRSLHDLLHNAQRPQPALAVGQVVGQVQHAGRVRAAQHGTGPSQRSRAEAGHASVHACRIGGAGRCDFCLPGVDRLRRTQARPELDGTRSSTPPEATRTL